MAWSRILIILLLFSAIGCVHDRNIHKIARITFVIHIVGDRSQFDLAEARVFGGPAGRTIDAYAKSGDPPEIWIRGYRDSRGIHIDEVRTLGHEVEEVLRLTDREFANPHE